MQLKSLYIKAYKLLYDFRIEFNQPLSLFIGKNGSGKSTVLEALAWILRGAYLHFIKEEKDVRPRFDFELHYSIRLDETIYETLMTGSFETNYVGVVLRGDAFNMPNWTLETDNSKYTKEDLIKKFGIKKLLPDNVLVYYAGWFETMRGICQPFEDDYKNRLRAKAKSTDEVYTRLEAQPMFYIQQYHFPMLLAALFSYQYNDDIDQFFKDKIGIINDSFLITFFIKKPNWQRNNKAETFWGAEGILLQFLEALAMKKIIDEEKIVYKFTNVFTDDEYNSKTGEYCFSINSEKWYKIKEVFGEEKKLFYLMNMLHASDMLSELRVATNKIDDTPISYWHLSEGEQQLITIKAINELLIEDNTLLLFNEPDTYLHPEWQRTFLGDIETMIESNNAHLIVTSHSPMMIANMKKGELYKMINGKAQLIKDGYYGKDYGFTLENYMGTSSEVEETHQDLSKLFELIETDKFKEAQILLEELNKKYPNEPELTRAQTMITLLTEED